jgi:FHS family L-fucose permease-like MFS transporter
MVDPLIASVKAVFSLSNTESMLTQFAYFMAYGVVSLPAAALVARAGYGKAIVNALVAMIVGCLVVPLATQLGTFELVLVALFIIASGVTVLQVAANPLVAGLGPPRWSHLRLLFSQAFNSLGTVIAPYIGSAIMLSGGVFAAKSGAAVDASQRTESLHNIDVAFFVVVGLIALLVVLILASRKRIEAAAPALTQSHETSVLPALRSRWAVLGAIAIFL